MAEKENKYLDVLDTVKRIAALYIENAKLTTAEKITMLLSGIAMFSVALVFSVLCLVFIAIGLSSLLSEFIAPFWSYFIIAGVFAVIVLVLLTFKEALILNPISKFITRILVDKPKGKEDQKR